MPHVHVDRCHLQHGSQSHTDFFGRAKDGQGGLIWQWKIKVNMVSKSVSVLHAHRGLDPNDCEGMSVSALSTPAMCRGVSGEQ